MSKWQAQYARRQREREAAEEAAYEKHLERERAALSGTIVRRRGRFTKEAIEAWLASLPTATLKQMQAGDLLSHDRIRVEDELERRDSAS